MTSSFNLLAHLATCMREYGRLNVSVTLQRCPGSPTSPLSSGFTRASQRRSVLLCAGSNVQSDLLKLTPQWDMTINHLTCFCAKDTKNISQDTNQDHPDTRRHDDKTHKSRSLKNTVEICDSSFSRFGEKFKQTAVLEKRAVARPKGARANEMRALVV